ncbi:MAG: thiosulfate oxidation carrier protein SoxY [Aquificaceae bacterium]|nr:thiosulfate oxidation carrier protein SoxY [Aquificaceae bacterium]
MDRRSFLFMGASFGLVALFSPRSAFASSRLEEEVRKRLGVPLSQIQQSDQVSINAPTIAESGANIPITVESTIPAERVEHLWIFADKNPVPWITDVRMTPVKMQFYFSTRIKMGETSNVRAILKLKDGSYVMNLREVKVTAGGCG